MPFSDALQDVGLRIDHYADMVFAGDVTSFDLTQKPGDDYPIGATLDGKTFGELLTPVYDVLAGLPTTFRWCIPEGETVPTHRHSRFSEQIFICSGAVSLLTPDQSRLMRAGDFAVIHEGIPHKLVAKADCELLIVFGPGVGIRVRDER